MRHKPRVPTLIFGAILRRESAMLGIWILLLFVSFLLLFLFVSAQVVQREGSSAQPSCSAAWRASTEPDGAYPIVLKFAMAVRQPGIGIEDR